MEIKGTEDKSDLLKSLLQSTTQKTTINHSSIYNLVRKNIASRLKQAASILQMLKITKDNKTEIAAFTGIFFGVFSAFLAEFVTKVREASR